MARISVYTHDDHDDRTLTGWFDPTTAEQFDEATEWNGNNHISKATNSQYDHQILYRTKGGRWVLHGWSQWQGRGETYQFITDDAARTWLLENEQDDAVRRFFGDIEEERGPGRPSIGNVLNVRLEPAQRDALTQLGRDGESLAATVRRLIDEAARRETLTSWVREHGHQQATVRTSAGKIRYLVITDPDTMILEGDALTLEIDDPDGTLGETAGRAMSAAHDRAAAEKTSFGVTLAELVNGLEYSGRVDGFDLHTL